MIILSVILQLRRWIASCLYGRGGLTVFAVLLIVIANDAVALASSERVVHSAAVKIRKRKPCKCAGTEKQVQAAVVNARSAFGPHSVEASFALVELGKIHQHQMKYADAVNNLQEAADIQSKVLGKSDIRTAYTLGLLATVYNDQGNSVEASRQAQLAMGLFAVSAKQQLPMQVKELNSELARIVIVKDKHKSVKNEAQP